MHCVRLPYNLMILAAGHYKQTQKNYIIAATINVVVSVILVITWGLIGVAIGTLVAMLYQTVWMAWYDSKNFFKISLKSFLKQLCVDAGTFVICFYICQHLSMNGLTYYYWLLLALEVFAIWFVIILIINCIFYISYIKTLYSKMSNRLNKSKTQNRN